MKCFHCGAWSNVRETRAAPHAMMRRRHECANGHLFTTMEVHLPVAFAVRRDAKATARKVYANEERYKRNMRIISDFRPTAEIAAEYKLTPTRVRQIKRGEKRAGK